MSPTIENAIVTMYLEKLYQNNILSYAEVEEVKKIMLQFLTSSTSSKAA